MEKGKLANVVTPGEFFGKEASSGANEINVKSCISQ